MEKEARKSESNQANRNLLLSEKAKVTSEPTSRSRTTTSFPRPVAQRMGVQGFLGEILDRIPVRHVRDAGEHELATRIG